MFNRRNFVLGSAALVITFLVSPAFAQTTTAAHTRRGFLEQPHAVFTMNSRIRPGDHLCPWNRQQSYDLVAAGRPLFGPVRLRHLFSSRLSAGERDWRSGPEGVRRRSCRPD